MNKKNRRAILERLTSKAFVDETKMPPVQVSPDLESITDPKEYAHQFFLQAVENAVNLAIAKLESSSGPALPKAAGLLKKKK